MYKKVKIRHQEVTAIFLGIIVNVEKVKCTKFPYTQMSFNSHATKAPLQCLMLAVVTLLHSASVYWSDYFVDVEGQASVSVINDHAQLEG